VEAQVKRQAANMEKVVERFLKDRTVFRAVEALGPAAAPLSRLKGKAPLSRCSGKGKKWQLLHEFTERVLAEWSRPILSGG